MDGPGDAPSSGIARGCVAIAASAGGLDALRTLLGGLPKDFPVPVLVVQHLAPDHISNLAYLIGRSCALTVHQAARGMRLEPGHVYIAPPDRHLLVRADGCLELTTTERVQHVRPSADLLFESAAAACGAAAIGVILSGMGHDGTAGAVRVREAGGRVVCSDEYTSRYFSMARSAIESGSVDAVLPLDHIAAWLIEAVGGATGS